MSKKAICITVEEDLIEEISKRTGRSISQKIEDLLVYAVNNMPSDETPTTVNEQDELKNVLKSIVSVARYIQHNHKKIRIDNDIVDTPIVKEPTKETKKINTVAPNGELV